jgi:hypothetical protein
MVTQNLLVVGQVLNIRQQFVYLFMDVKHVIVARLHEVFV